MAISRRRFLRETAAAAGGIAIAPWLEEAARGETTDLPRRVLGRTKQRVSIVGFGMAPLGSDNTPPDAVERIVCAALDMGINYVDVAPVYGDPDSRFGNAEMKLPAVMKRHRGDLFLVTKVNPGSGQTKEGVQRQLEQSLKHLGTDHADLVHIHNLGDWDMDRLFGPDGAIAGLQAAQKRGLLRFIGTSGHSRPARFARAIETGLVDVTMNALNFADRHTYDFEGLVLPAAKKHGTAVVAMKVLGGTIGWNYDGRTQAALATYHERAIRYSLGLPGVCCAVIGFNNEDEVKQALAVARAYKPLSAAEKTALLAEGKQVAQARGLYYGPVDG